MSTDELPRPARGVLRRSQEQQAQAQPDLTAPICRHCQSGQVRLVAGRYGPALECRSCGQTTPVKANCPVCGGRARLTHTGPHPEVICPAGRRALYPV